MEKLLIAEDDRIFRKALCGLLEGAGYSVRGVPNGKKAVEAHRVDSADLILLDLEMPVLDGFGACEEIRKFDSDVPILFLTGYDTSSNEIKALGIGVDKFIVKGEDDEVLLANIAASLRRLRRIKEESAIGDFVFGNVKICAAKLQVESLDFVPISFLNEREVALLRYFAKHPDEVISQDFLLTHFWPNNPEVTDAILRVAIHRLRSKLGSSGPYLHSVRNSGYVYRK